jgi:hypothetical protein
MDLAFDLSRSRAALIASDRAMSFKAGLTDRKHEGATDLPGSLAGTNFRLVERSAEAGELPKCHFDATSA